MWELGGLILCVLSVKRWEAHITQLVVQYTHSRHGVVSASGSLLLSFHSQTTLSVTGVSSLPNRVDSSFFVWSFASMCRYCVCLLFLCVGMSTRKLRSSSPKETGTRHERIASTSRMGHQKASTGCMCWFASCLSRRFFFFFLRQSRVHFL